ncbi:MAG: tRNA (guanosine(37)-N1)-methyltransferase TrmD [Nitrospirota bacterium]
MKIDVLTLFPEFFDSPLKTSIINRAQTQRLVEIKLLNLRDFTKGKHHTVDDTPYGGGPGMVIKPEPVFEAVESLKPGLVILLTPQGKVFNQEIAGELSTQSHLIFICGHYEGVDERIVEELVDEEISIGDYILTGGEIPCLVVIDAVVRLIPEVLGNPESLESDSFAHQQRGKPLLAHPQYTKPQNFRGQMVPDVLVSGDHGKIRLWRKKQALAKTLTKRPDLLEKAILSNEDKKLLQQIIEERKEKKQK